jgi:signal transduction histidine kinase
MPVSWCLVLMAFTAARGEHLPVKLYAMADGLPSSEITRNVPDSHGLFWFCTSEGMSRFDGYRLADYGVEQGLPDARVTGLLETRDGRQWLATALGISRFLPGSSLERLEFTILPPFWLQWWFWSSVAAAVFVAALSAHRYRLRHALQLERDRTRIATDLHDDIGSGLTQISVLSEVVRKNLNDTITRRRVWRGSRTSPANSWIR